MTKLARISLSLLLLAGAVSSAFAAVVSYSSRAAWNTAVGASTTETFNAIVADQSFPTTAGIYSFSGGSGLNGVDTQKIDAASFYSLGDWDVNGTTYVLADLLSSGDNSLRIDFALGLTAWGADLRGAANDGRTIHVNVFDAADALLGSFDLPAALSTFGLSFAGFQITGGGTADHIVFTLTNTTAVNDVFGLDDFSSVAPSAVPLPATGALAALAIGMLGFARRRRA